MFYQIASGYLEKLADYNPCAPITDRPAWEILYEKWKDQNLRLGEKYLKYPYPVLSATDYMDFTRTGNRTRFENKYFSRRRALSSLVLAECIEDDGRFIDDIINGIFSICEESGWQLPAHNAYIRDTPQLILPDAVSPILDLFACETGAILSTTQYLLKERLDSISPSINKRISHELKQRILQPYLEKHFWWMGDGIQPMNNWTIWCTQNILLSVFLTDTDQTLRFQIFQKACRSVDYFLDEYGEDGCCDEGAQYYRHAGLCLFHVMEILNSITDNAFLSLYEDSKIRNIASYILNVHIDDKYYINFADCSPIAGRAGVREFLFAERTHNANMMLFAARDHLAGEPDTLLMSSENNLYYRLLNGFTAKRIRQYAAAHPEPVLHSDIYYESVGLFVARDNTLCLAVKAGNNADSHNHNDTGSFTVYKNGLPLIIDVGVESYTQKTFSPRRYEIWTMQSAYHNLPTVNGIMQKDGADYSAKDVFWHLSENLCEITMDISNAYPAEAGLMSYQRSVALHKKSSKTDYEIGSNINSGKIVIKDRFSLSESVPVVLTLMTFEKPTPRTEAQGLLLLIGDLGSLTVSQCRLIAIEEIPITDPRLQTAWTHNLYRTLIKPDCSELEISIQ